MMDDFSEWILDLTYTYVTINGTVWERLISRAEDFFEGWTTGCVQETIQQSTSLVKKKRKHKLATLIPLILTHPKILLFLLFFIFNFLTHF